MFGVTKIHAAIKDFIEFDLDAGFIFDAPYVRKETEEATLQLLISGNDLGRINLGRSQVRLKKVDQIVTPLLKRFDIAVKENRATLRDDKLRELGNLKADSLDELQNSIDLIGEYIQKGAIPFWNKYSDLSMAAKLADDASDLTDSFCDEIDFNVITLMKLAGSKCYETKKVEFLQNQVALANHSNDFASYPKAFQALIEKLEES